MKKLLISLLLSSPVTILAMENNNNNVATIDAIKALSMDQRETLTNHNCDPARWCTWFWCGPCLVFKSADAEFVRMDAEHAAHMIQLVKHKAEFNAIMGALGYKEDNALYEKELRYYDEKRRTNASAVSGLRPSRLDIVLTRYIDKDGRKFQPDADDLASGNNNDHDKEK